MNILFHGVSSDNDVSGHSTPILAKQWPLGGWPLRGAGYDCVAARLEQDSKSSTALGEKSKNGATRAPFLISGRVRGRIEHLFEPGSDAVAFGAAKRPSP